MRQVQSQVRGEWGVRRRCDDRDLLRIPHFSGDIWIQESNEKCKELVKQGFVAEGETDEASRRAEEGGHPGRRRVRKRGRLLSEVFEVMKVIGCIQGEK